MTADPPTYWQVVRPVTFQHENLNFSLTTSIMGGAGTSPLDSAGADHAAPELTKNVTADPKSATPTYLEGGNIISNLTHQQGWRIRNSPLKSTLTSRQREVLE